MQRSQGFVVLVWCVVASACAGEPSAEVAPATPAVKSDYAPAPTGKAADGPSIGTLGGVSCEAAKATWADEAAAKNIDYPAPPPEHDAALGAALNRGSYLTPCAVPTTSSVKICVAVVDGEPRGVSVRLEPGDKALADCVATEVGKLKFPSHATMSITTTSFDAAN